jgi:hypothetical protein
VRALPEARFAIGFLRYELVDLLFWHDAMVSHSAQPCVGTAQKCEARYRHGSSVTEMPGKVLAKISFLESRIYEPAPKCRVIVAWNTLRSMSHCEPELVVLLELICDQVL